MMMMHNHCYLFCHCHHHHDVISTLPCTPPKTGTRCGSVVSLLYGICYCCDRTSCRVYCTANSCDHAHMSDYQHRHCGVTHHCHRYVVSWVGVGVGVVVCGMVVDFLVCSVYFLYAVFVFLVCCVFFLYAVSAFPLRCVFLPHHMSAPPCTIISTQPHQCIPYSPQPQPPFLHKQQAT